MGILRGIDGSEPLRPDRIERPTDLQPERRASRSWWLGTGTLACPACDAPVVLPVATMAPRDQLACPLCDHDGTVRDFLSMEQPTRPTRVSVRAVYRPRANVNRVASRGN